MGALAGADGDVAGGANGAGERSGAAATWREKEVHELGAQRFAEEAEKCRELARVNRLEGPALDRGMALVREAAWRSVGLRPFPVQVMGALAMIEGNIAEMATGEGKTLTASL